MRHAGIEAQPDPAGAFGSYRYDPLIKLYAQRKSLAEDGQRILAGAKGGSLVAEREH